MKKHNEYSPLTLMIMFLIFSHIGWIWEGYITLRVMGILVNRGFMHGPWLPVYGSGVVLLLIVWQGKKAPVWKVFCISAMICGVLEYAASFVMELLFKEKWWDYSGEFFNINGRTCLSVIVLFGIAGSLVVCVVGPLMNRGIRRLSLKVKKRFCTVVGALFVLDYMISFLSPNTGVGITF